MTARTAALSPARHVIALAASLCLAVTPLAVAPTHARAQTLTQAALPANTLLTLSASGDVRATPDMATINFAVVTQGATASDAMKANNVRMNAVMAALKSAGIAAKDIQTSSLNLNPQYVYADGQSPKLTGYQAQNQITVRVNDLSQTGPVIDTVIKAGINQVDSITFGLKDDQTAMDTARQTAIANLMKRANLYAAATGQKVKRIVSIEEGGPVVNVPRPMVMMAARMKADASTPVSAGEMEMSVQVSATFELEK